VRVGKAARAEDTAELAASDAARAEEWACAVAVSTAALAVAAMSAPNASPRRVKSAAAAAAEEAEEATIEEMEPPLSGCCCGGESPAGAGAASDMAVERSG
jgi:hypothetical protein